MNRDYITMPGRGKYTYLFAINGNVHKRSVRARSKYDARIKVLNLYPEARKAGINWMCLAEGENVQHASASLHRWATTIAI